MSDEKEEEPIIMHYTGRTVVEKAVFYCPNNPVPMSERDEILLEIDLIETENERKQKNRKKPGR